MKTLIILLFSISSLALFSQVPQLEVIGVAGENAIEINGIPSNGIYIDNNDTGLRCDAGNISLWSSNASQGLRITNPSVVGFEVTNSSGYGGVISGTNLFGLQIDNAGTDALVIISPADDGISISSAADDAITISNSGDSGINVFNAGGHGGYFETAIGSGTPAIEAANLDDDELDIKLNSHGLIGSDGRIDLKLDVNNNSLDFFRVLDSNDNFAMSLREDGIMYLPTVTGQLIMLLNNGITVAGAAQQAGFFSTGVSVTEPAMELSSGDDAIADLRLNAHGRMTMGGDFNIHLDDNNNGFNSLKLFDSATNQVFSVDEDGGTTINTTYLPPGYKVSVDGKIICEELTVQLSGSWPDYVFKNNYDLMSISELKVFLKKNKHLPNIPSASEIEDSGISIGDMQKRMMEKIEELTLYIIQLEEKIQNK